MRRGRPVRSWHDDQIGRLRRFAFGAVDAGEGRTDERLSGHWGDILRRLESPRAVLHGRGVVIGNVPGKAKEVPGARDLPDVGFAPESGLYPANHDSVVSRNHAAASRGAA